MLSATLSIVWIAAIWAIRYLLVGLIVTPIAAYMIGRVDRSVGSLETGLSVVLWPFLLIGAAWNLYDNAVQKCEEYGSRIDERRVMRKANREARKAAKDVSREIKMIQKQHRATKH